MKLKEFKKVGVPIGLALMCSLTFGGETNFLESKSTRLLTIQKFEHIGKSVDGGNTNANASWQVIGYTELVAFEHTGDMSSGIACWTNTHPVFSSRMDPAFSQHIYLGQVIADGRVFVCYKEGPALIVEQILPKPQSGSRERYWLERDSGVVYSPWMLAAFTNQTAVGTALTVTNLTGSVLTWNLGTNGAWELNSKNSKPDAARSKAAQEWAHLILESNKWKVLERLPEPLSKE